MLYQQKQSVTTLVPQTMRWRAGRKHKRSLRKQVTLKQAAVYKRMLTIGKQLSVHITLDANEGYFKGGELNMHDVDYLLNKKYHILYRQDIFGKRDFYLVQPRGNESVEHFFLVKNIAAYLKRFFNVWLYHSVRPDIIFEFKNKKVAIEIETGKVLRTNKKSLIEKVKMLNEQFGDDWFFVVTNRNIAKKYRQFGKTFTRQTVLKKLKTYTDNKLPKAHRRNPLKRSLYNETSTYYYPI